jgi:hypothetical protein
MALKRRDNDAEQELTSATHTHVPNSNRDGAKAEEALGEKGRGGERVPKGKEKKEKERIGPEEVSRLECGKTREKCYYVVESVKKSSPVKLR